MGTFDFMKDIQGKVIDAATYRCRDCGASRRRAICVELSPSRGLGIAPGILVWTAVTVGVRQAQRNGPRAVGRCGGGPVRQPEEPYGGAVGQSRA